MKIATTKQGATGPNPRWMKKKEKRKKSADKLDPEKNTGDLRSNYSKPLLHLCYRKANGAASITWAATLALSQAGAKRKYSYSIYWLIKNLANILLTAFQHISFFSQLFGRFISISAWKSKSETDFQFLS